MRNYSSRNGLLSNMFITGNFIFRYIVQLFFLSKFPLYWSSVQNILLLILEKRKKKKVLIKTFENSLLGLNLGKLNCGKKSQK